MHTYIYSRSSNRREKYRNCDDMTAGLSLENDVTTVIKAREGRRSGSPFSFISNNSLSLVYCTVYTEAASFPSQNKAPKISLPAHGTCIYRAACRNLCVCVCVCVFLASTAARSMKFSINNWKWRRNQLPKKQNANCKTYLILWKGGAKGGVKRGVEKIA